MNQRSSLSLFGAHRVALLMTGLLAGSALANFLLESSLDGSLAFDVEYKQLVIRAYTVALPALGIGGILAALAVVFLARHHWTTAWLAALAAACLVAGIVITLTVHFPINARIMTWDPAAPPADAAALLERWNTANAVRTATAIVAFVLLLLASGARTPAERQDVRNV